MLHLDYGGAEKQTITMANKLGTKYNVEIISFYRLKDKPAYEINANIKIKYLYDGKPNREEFKKYLKQFHLFKCFKEGIKALKILYLKKKLIKREIILNDADIYFSTRTEYGKLLSKYGDENKLKVTEEHNFFDDKKYQRKIIKGYKNLDYVVVVNKYQEKMYNEWFKNSKVKIVRIENSIENNSLKSKLNNNAIIAVGRLDPIKDFTSLIEVMHLLVKDKPTLKLYLLGSGQEKDLLSKKIKEYNLEKNVIMPGFVTMDEVYEYMAKSDLYIMTSFRESFALVLAEAYSCGLPVISFDILTGPKEIVKNNQTGYLIKNRSIKEMTSKINELLDDKKKLKEFSKNAYLESKQYTIDNIAKKWENLFK